jgi:Ca2+-binding RTX toxin-like protein
VSDGFYHVSLFYNGAVIDVEIVSVSGENIKLDFVDPIAPDPLNEIIGTSGKDILRGLSDQPNTILGLAGNDTIYGGALGDTIDGGAGNDRIFAGGGDDLITDPSGKNQVDGGAGFDTLAFDASYESFRVSTKGSTTRITDSGGSWSSANIEALKFTDGIYDVTSGSFTP